MNGDRIRVKRALLLCALGAAACSRENAAGVPSTSSSAGAPAAQTFVVFDTRAPLCREPKLDWKVCFQQTPTARWARFEGVGRLVEDRGEWILVETTDPWQVGQHCAADSNTALNQLGLRLRFFLQRSALLRVTESQTLAYPNKTSITLRGGTPLLAPEGAVTRDLAVVDPGGFPLLLPRAEVRSAEMYVETPPVAESPQALEVAGGRTMRYGTPLPAKDYPADPENQSSSTAVPEAPGILRHPLHSTDVYTQAPNPAGVLVELRSPCAILHVIVGADALVSSPSRGSWSATSADFLLRKTQMPRTSRWRVRANAPLFFPGGAPAGVVGSLSAPFDGNEKPLDGRVCMERPLFGIKAPPGATGEQIQRGTPTLCADSRDVVLWPRFWSDAEAATISAGTRAYVHVEVENRSELDPATVTNEVRGALRDALLVAGGFAIAPPGQTAEEARAIAKARGLGAAQIRVRVGPVEINRSHGWFSVRRSVRASLTRPDGSTAELPNLSGLTSPGAEHVVDGKPTAAFLRATFERSMMDAAMGIRTRLMAGDKPIDTSRTTSVADLPAWAFPPGWSH